MSGHSAADNQRPLMDVLLSIHSYLLRPIVPIVVASVVLGWVVARAQRRHPQRVRRALLWSVGFAAGYFALVVVVLPLTVSQACWMHLRSLPADRITRAVVSWENLSITVDAATARELHAVLAAGDRSAGHHSGPGTPLTLSFEGEGLTPYRYRLAPDSKRVDEYWISDLTNHCVDESDRDMGQFVSKPLTDLLNSILAR